MSGRAGVVTAVCQGGAGEVTAVCQAGVVVTVVFEQTKQHDVCTVFSVMLGTLSPLDTWNTIAGIASA